MAGFQLTLYGRIWVTPEDHSKDQGAKLLLTRLRPPTRRNLEIHVQYKRNPARSQFTTVRGVTKTRGFLHPDQNVLNATQNSLCRAVIECEAVARAKRAVADGEPSFRGRGPRGSEKSWRSTRGDAGAAQSWQEYYRNYRIQFCAKSFVLGMYDVLATQVSKPERHLILAANSVIRHGHAFPEEVLVVVAVAARAYSLNWSFRWIRP